MKIPLASLKHFDIKTNILTVNIVLTNIVWPLIYTIFNIIFIRIYLITSSPRSAQPARLAKCQPVPIIVHSRRCWEPACKHHRPPTGHPEWPVAFSPRAPESSSPARPASKFPTCWRSVESGQRPGLQFFLLAFPTHAGQLPCLTDYIIMMIDKIVFLL